MNTLLGIANGMFQYYKGRQNGLAGLIGILVALTIAWQWEHVLPILNKLGIVSFFESIGLVYDQPYLTGFAIVIFIFKLVIVYSIIVLLLIISGIFLSYLFSNEKFIKYVFMPLFVAFTFPIFFLITIFNLIFNRKKHIEYNKQLQQKKEIESTKSPSELLIYRNDALRELLNESTEISTEEAFVRLNKLPTYGDNLYLLGIPTWGQKIYILTPRPLKVQNSKFLKNQLYAIPITIEYKEPTDYRQVSMFKVEPKKYNIDWKNSDVSKMSIRCFERIFVTDQIDLNRVFKQINVYLEKSNYIAEEQNEYFSQKESLLNRISNARTKELFDELVAEVRNYDAMNDEIVKIMLENKKTVEVSWGFNG